MIRILLIEDNPMDARLMQHVFGASKGWPAQTTPVQTTWIDDGQKALWYLRSLEEGGVDERPSLVLLDLNLPKYDGLQVLEEFRKSATARNLPIFLMSSTPASEIAGLAESRHLHADGYFEKPYGLSELEQFARRVCELVDLNFSEPRTVAA